MAVADQEASHDLRYLEAGDDELRLWTLDKTSQMRGSREGQEGLSSFLERRARLGIRRVSWYYDSRLDEFSPRPFDTVLVANREIAVRVLRLPKNLDFEVRFIPTLMQAPYTSKMQIRLCIFQVLL